MIRKWEEFRMMELVFHMLEEIRNELLGRMFQVHRE
jgi:hypothetical protein